MPRLFSPSRLHPRIIRILFVVGALLVVALFSFSSVSAQQFTSQQEQQVASIASQLKALQEIVNRLFLGKTPLVVRAQVTDTISLWNNSATPSRVVPDFNGVELGVKFKSDVAGTITAIRFHKGSTNTGAHSGNLWSSTGQLLGTVNFTNETASGWQQANFASPIAISANTVYIASYYTNTGYFVDNNYFATKGVDTPPLHALQDGASGANGVYLYSSTSGFPTQTYQSSNYWVDVEFKTSTPPGPDTIPPTISITAPLNNATVPISSVAVSANASDNIAVAGVQFKLDGNNLGAEDTFSPYSASWDTAQVASGSHTLTAVARDTSNNQTTSAAITITVSNLTYDTEAPSIPANLSASAVSSSQINLTWTASTDNVGVTGYHIERCQGATCTNFIQIAAPTTNSFSDNSLTANTAYRYQVRAVDAAGNLSGYSSIASATTLIQAASTIEAICQSNPNVLLCDNFETGDMSRWIGPAINPGPSTDWPFMGSYSLKYAWGDLDTPSYSWHQFPAGTNEIRARFYVYFDPLFRWGFGSGTDHTFSLQSAGGTTCTGSPGFFDFGPMDALIYRPNTESCMDRKDPHLNMGIAADRTLYNGKWHRLEYHLKLNTVGGCTDRNGNGRFDAQGECNGVYEVWYNGKQVMGYYDFNNRSNDAGYYIADMLFNHYYRTGGQTYNNKGFNEYRDNLVILSGSNGGQLIGPVAGEPALGTPDLMSPYKTEVYKEWVAYGIADGRLQRIRPGGDCGSALMLQDPSGPGTWFHGGASIVSTPAHNQVVTSCNLTGGGDRAMMTRTDSTMGANSFSGDGLGMPRGFPNRTYVLNTWMYLDPTTFPAPNGASLSGMFSYGTGNGRRYVAMGVDSQNRVTLVSRMDPASGAPAQMLGTNPTVTITPGVWYRIEVRGNEDHVWSVLVNGVEVIRQTNVDDAALWADPYPEYHFGISDHRNNPNPLQVVIDEMSAGSTSFQDCFGWNPSVCPWQTLADTQAPTVSITTPANGATVSGTITISANASDNVGVAGVQFLLDGVNLGTEVLTAPYTFTWNTTTATNGIHTLTARARDAAGNQTTSAAVTITVNNLVPSYVQSTYYAQSTYTVIDSTPPTQPTNPSPSSISSSELTLTWTPSTDNIQVTAYKIERCSGSSCINFIHIAATTNPSYIDTTLTPNTVYRYQIKSLDQANNVSSYSVIVNATTLTAPTPAPTPTPTSSSSGTTPSTPVSSGGGGGGGGAGSELITQSLPQQVTNLQITPTKIGNILTWTNPIDSRFARTRILRKEGNKFSVSPLDGTIVYEGIGTSTTDTFASAIATSTYSVFTFDSSNYSLPVTSMIAPIPSPSSASFPPPVKLIKPLSRTITLTRSLFKGFKHTEVKILQEFLIAEGFLASGNNSAFFGTLTESAVKVFQCKTKIVCTGTSVSTGWGAIGPKTRTFLRQDLISSDTQGTLQLQEQVRALQQQIERLKKR